MAQPLQRPTRPTETSVCDVFVWLVEQRRAVVAVLSKQTVTKLDTANTPSPSATLVDLGEAVRVATLNPQAEGVVANKASQ